MHTNQCIHTICIYIYIYMCVCVYYTLTIYIYIYIYIYKYVCWVKSKVAIINVHTAILIIIESQFQVFQRFSSGKLVLKTVESCFVALNYHENGSMHDGSGACEQVLWLCGILMKRC